MEKEPLVSVIIACHNCEKYIDKCIHSITNQTYKNIEIIICDDASEDKSVELIKKHQENDPRIIFLSNKKSLRAGATRNRCIACSSGEYILIQDADDYSDYSRIETLLDVLNNNPDISFVSSAAYLFSNDDDAFDTILYPRKKRPQKKDFLWGISFVHAATLFRASCLKAVSGYRVAKETVRGQDYDMIMRLYAAGYTGMNIATPLYWVRVDKTSLKRRVKSSPYNEYLIRKKGYKLLGLMPIGYIFVCLICN